MSDVSSSLLDVESVRRDFPILGKSLPKGRKLVYLDTGASAQKPRQVIDAERDCYENFYANAYRGAYYFGERVSEELEATRSTVCEFLGAGSPQEIVFTSGTTAAVNLVASGWGNKFLKPGDALLINEMEHHANFVPWQQLAQRTGAELKFIPLTDDGRLDLDRLDDVLTANVRLIAVTGMSNVLGTVNPVTEIARRAKQHGALVLVDGAQSVPHRATNVEELGVDFLTFSGHKIYGPSGVGVLWGKLEHLEAMDPLLFGGHMVQQVTTKESTWMPPPAKFEAGTIPIAQAIALRAAVDYVTGLGFEAIEASERAIVEYALAKLLEVPGLRLLGPAAEHRGSIFSFTIEDAHPQDIAYILSRQGIAVRHGHHCTMPLHETLGISASTRASFGVYNTQDEVDALVDGLLQVRKRLRLD